MTFPIKIIIFMSSFSCLCYCFGKQTRTVTVEHRLNMLGEQFTTVVFTVEPDKDEFVRRRRRITNERSFLAEIHRLHITANESMVLMNCWVNFAAGSLDASLLMLWLLNCLNPPDYWLITDLTRISEASEFSSDKTSLSKYAKRSLNAIEAPLTDLTLFEIIFPCKSYPLFHIIDYSVGVNEAILPYFVCVAQRTGTEREISFTHCAADCFATLFVFISYALGVETNENPSTAVIQNAVRSTLAFIDQHLSQDFEGIAVVDFMVVVSMSRTQKVVFKHRNGDDADDIMDDSIGAIGDYVAQLENDAKKAMMPVLWHSAVLKRKAVTIGKAPNCITYKATFGDQQTPLSKSATRLSTFESVDSSRSASSSAAMVDEKVHPIALIPPFQSTVLVDFHNNNFPNEAELLNTISACCYVAHYYGSVIEAVACNTSTLSAAKLNALKAYQVVILPQGVKKAASVETVLVDYCFSLIKPREPGRCFVICTNQIQAAPLLRTIAEHGRTVILITWDAELMTKTIEYLDPQNPQVFKLDDIILNLSC
ncbi:hypothetical protein BCR33DRAFT_820645 [Rhizoclosmatium globosum]|uniref:Receptor ligand binding region domain-containing protein n=1 Tax=Rhizoclosmatium globosum TaxID=329046 RepID=A0A1Y2C9M4_9FUNG|nr:hypothetical protein BCR33DRAFT_820645 [Rhizoclosmatium globosum]|eukprot:ORY43015.1 hypothetical protein BCR33DRAFT_820645 [Rhizoclosmatium globosum]